jgi:predicted outer membrane repeat protein
MMRMGMTARSVRATLAVTAVLAMTASAATAATYSVTTTADTPGLDCLGANACSLRGALARADLVPFSTVLLPAGDYVLAQGQLTIATATRILGAGAATTTIRQPAGATQRVLLITSDAYLGGVTIRDGNEPVVGAAPLGLGGNIAFIPTSSDAVLTLDTVVVDHGTAAGSGGGVFQDGGWLQAFDSTISDNTAPTGGGYAEVGSADQPGYLAGVTVAGNHASGGEGLGGGVMVDAGSLQVLDSTFTANTALQAGGAISARQALNPTQPTVVLMGGTLSGNAAPTGSELHVAGPFEVANAILGPPASGSVCSSPVVAISTLATDASCTTQIDGNLVGVDPLLGPLAANGGPTQTLMPGAGSPAIDAGADALCDTIDQRGFPRPLGEHCDIGAVETTPAPPGGGDGGGGGDGSGGLGAGGGGGGIAATTTSTTAPSAGAPDPTLAPVLTGPAPAPLPIAPATPAPVRTRVLLSRTGRVTVIAALSPLPMGRVTLTWTVRQGGRTHRGIARVAALRGTVVTRIALPHRLSGATLVRVTASYRTADGGTRTVRLK